LIPLPTNTASNVSMVVARVSVTDYSRSLHREGCHANVLGCRTYGAGRHSEQAIRQR